MRDAVNPSLLGCVLLITALPGYLAGCLSGEFGTGEGTDLTQEPGAAWAWLGTPEAEVGWEAWGGPLAGLKVHESQLLLPLLPGLEGGRAFFNAVKEGDTVIFASDDEQDRILWVQAMYRATGQSHKPVPPTQVQKLNAKGGNVPQLDAPISQFCK